MKHRCCGAEGIDYVFSSKMGNRTLSKICGRLYLPINISIQGRVINSNIYCFFYGPGHILPSLSIILKLSSVVWPVMFRCSPNTQTHGEKTDALPAWSCCILLGTEACGCLIVMSGGEGIFLLLQLMVLCLMGCKRIGSCLPAGRNCFLYWEG